MTVPTTLATVSISPLKKHLPGKQYPVDVDVNKLSRLGNKHLTPISLRRETLYIPSATHMLYIAYIQVRIIFPLIEVSIPLFFETFV